MSVVIEARNIAKSYGDNLILQDVSLHVDEGELVSLLGVSGAGKTTLFRVLAGLEIPQAGQVMLRGEDVTGVTGKMSYMPQRDLLLPHKKIIDNVALPLILRGEHRRASRERAMELLTRFGLEQTAMQYPAQLSGGMRQRAALLRTFLGSRGVMLLDEPFSALDARTKRELHEWYGEVMQKLHLTTLFITHDMEEAASFSDRVYLLSGRPGKITAEVSAPIQKQKLLELLDGHMCV